MIEERSALARWLHVGCMCSLYRVFIFFYFARAPLGGI